MVDVFYNGPLAERIGEWADRLLTPYLSSHPRPSAERKQIHDPLARIIELEPWEMYVVDSPVMQRLRYIRQLGVGHFLFPTAGYSRFEHSLGAMQMASMMFDSVFDARATAHPTAGPPAGSEALAIQRITVRLAALVHDIGHCVFSHVSERVYQEHADLRAAQAYFGDKFKQGRLSASETVSLLIVQSPAFRRLLTASRISRGPSEEVLQRDIMMCVAGSVSGMAPHSYLAEIINGSVDCDKLDYLARDAHMAGVPIPLDTTRLLSKLRIAVKRKEGEDDKFTLAIVPSGMRALDELQVARIFLFDKFYYHQKIMAAEELIRRALRSLSSRIPQLLDPAVLLAFGDDEFLALTPSQLLTRFGGEEDAELNDACDLLRRVRTRDLPKRAFAMANRFIPDPPELLALFHASGRPVKTKEQNVDFFEMTQRLRSQRTIEDYRRQIGAMARELGATTEVYFAHQAPGRAASSMYLPVLRSDNKLDEKPKYLFANDFWTEAYATNKATSYVFADNPSVDVFLATERFISSKWCLFFDRSSWVTAKLSEDEIAHKRQTLHGDWVPYRVRPDFLETRAATAKINGLNTRFGSFLSAFDSTWGSQLIPSWLAQFPDGDLQESALAFLEHITFVGPGEIEKAFQGFVDGDPALRQAIWVPFRAKRGPGDSADQLSVDLKGITHRNQQASVLQAAEIRQAGAVVFYDDTLNSGIQSQCRVNAWFGGSAADCEHPEDWDADGLLGSDVQDALRGVTTVFAFYAKHPAGDSRLRKTAAALGIEKLDVRGVVDSGLPRYTLDGFEGATVESRERFVEFMRRVGIKILGAKIGMPGWTQTRVNESALGYSGIPLTIVFRHSISTSTPVALWGMRTDFDDPWMPVFPRDVGAMRKLLRADEPQYQGT